MSYDEAIEANVSKNEVKAELAKHGYEFSEFAADCGDLDEYTGADVLAWMGY